MAGVIFKVNTSGMNEVLQKIKGSATIAETIVAEQVKKDTSPFVPALTGSLDQRTRVEGNAIIYPAPYARFLYYGKLMVDPETGSAWASKGSSKVLTDKNLVFNKAIHSKAQSHWFEASKAENIKKWERVAARAVGEEIG